MRELIGSRGSDFMNIMTKRRVVVIFLGLAIFQGLNSRVFAVNKSGGPVAPPSEGGVQVGGVPSGTAIPARNNPYDAWDGDGITPVSSDPQAAQGVPALPPAAPAGQALVDEVVPDKISRQVGETLSPEGIPGQRTEGLQAVEELSDAVASPGLAGSIVDGERPRVSGADLTLTSVPETQNVARLDKRSKRSLSEFNGESLKKDRSDFYDPRDMYPLAYAKALELAKADGFKDTQLRFRELWVGNTHPQQWWFSFGISGSNAYISVVITFGEHPKMSSSIYLLGHATNDAFPGLSLTQPYYLHRDFNMSPGDALAAVQKNIPGFRFSMFALTFREDQSENHIGEIDPWYGFGDVFSKGPIVFVNARTGAVGDSKRFEKKAPVPPASGIMARILGIKDYLSSLLPGSKERERIKWIKREARLAAEAPPVQGADYASEERIAALGLKGDDAALFMATYNEEVARLRGEPYPSVSGAFH